MNEGTPSTMQSLVRTDGLTKEVWNHILENLRRRIFLFHDAVTFERIADLRIAGNKTPPKIRGHQISEDFEGKYDPKGGMMTFEEHRLYSMLELRGYFFLAPTFHVPDNEHGPRLVRGIWGLDREGRWVSGYVEVDHGRDHFGDCSYQTAKGLKVSVSNPDEIVSGLWRYGNGCNLTYRNLWFSLSDAFSDSVKEREERLHPMQSLRDDLSRESFVLREVSEEVKVA